MNNKSVYCVATTLLSLMMLGGAGMYVFNNTEVAKVFESLGYPTYIIYPLAVAKILGLIAIWSNFNKSLTEWAYAGFFYDLVLAVAAHVSPPSSVWRCWRFLTCSGKEPPLPSS